MGSTDRGSYVSLRFSVLITSEDVTSPVSCEVSVQENPVSPFETLLITEPVSASTNITWPETLRIKYRFQRQQLVYISIFQTDFVNKSLIGAAQCELFKLLEPQITLHLYDQSNCIVGSLSVQCEEISETKKKLLLLLAGRNLTDLDTFSKSDPYIKIHKLEETWKLMYKSRVITDNLNPEWEPIVFDYTSLTDNNPNTILKFECFDYDSETKSEFIGACELSVSMLQENATFPLVNLLTNSSSNQSTLLIKKVECIEEASFIDYLRQGMSFSLTIAIDYTSSNGLAKDKSSLHYLGEDLNEYELTLEAVCKIMANYTKAERYAVFGFGGEPEGLGHVSHCFNLNNTLGDPYISGISNVLSTYRQNVQSVVLSGPTYWSEILKKLLELCAEERDSVYHILLIVTDGDINDFPQALDLIVELSAKPVSILIVGVGHESFDLLKKLDSDQGLLKNSHGKPTLRDIVQFVPFRRYEKRMHDFTRQALMEIPSQLMSYMKLVKNR